MCDPTQDDNPADEARGRGAIRSASEREVARARGAAARRRRPNGPLVFRVVLVSLLALAIVSDWGLLRAVGAQVYFEPTDEALRLAARGRHAEAVWAVVLFVAGFVMATASERMVLLMNVAPPLLAVAAGNPVAVAVGCVVVGLVDVAMVPIILLAPKARGSGRRAL